MKSHKSLRRRPHLFLVKLGHSQLLILAFAVTVVLGLLKILMHSYGWEPLAQSFSPFFSSVVTGIVFLLGFLLAGVLTDYKESEKLPGEILSSIHTIWEEATIWRKDKDSRNSRALQRKVIQFIQSLESEFLIKREVGGVLALLDSFSDNFMTMSKHVRPDSITRVKTEQKNLRKILIRIETIRGSSFSHSVYKAVLVAIIIVVAGVLLMRLDPFVESVFFLCLYVFFLVSTLIIVKDLDDPFEYQEGKMKVEEIDFSMVYDYGKTLSAEPKRP